MYGLVENKVLGPHEEDGREVALERLGKTTVEDRQAMPYVVRDLSWQLARFLEAQDR
jgi:hypothetical protein